MTYTWHNDIWRLMPYTRHARRIKSRIEFISPRPGEGANLDRGVKVLYTRNARWRKSRIEFIYIYLYNNVTSVCIFINIGCWPCIHHIDGVKSTSDYVSGLLFLFSCPQNPSINHLNFYCIIIKQINYSFPCACTVIIL